MALSGDNYIARRATVATWPALFPGSSCPDTEERSTAPLASSTAADTPHVFWRGQFVAPLHRLIQLYRENCQAAAILRFLRAPYWLEEDDETLVLELFLHRTDEHAKPGRHRGTSPRCSNSAKS